MVILITVLSILAITILVWLFNKFLPFRVCPVCAGVAGTWLWILAGIYFSWLDVGSWSLVAAIAMGGSVVGIAYQIEKRLPSGHFLIFWKAFFIITGFIAVYGFLSAWWPVFIAAAALLIVLLILPLAKRTKSDKINKTVEELEKKMDDCC